jgi:renalase
MNNDDTSFQALVIGAGLAGLSCAQALQGAGIKLAVLEKSGDIGGRIATRRRPQGIWNHGAPLVTAGTPAFATVLQGLVAAGSARVDGRVPTTRGNADAIAGALYRGVPDMRELLRPLAENVDLRCNSEVVAVRRHERGWLLEVSGQEALRCDVLLCAVPAPQAQQLLQTAGSQQALQALQGVTMDPCWALLLRYAQPLDLGCVAADPIIALAHPGAAGTADGGTTWVVHADPRWSGRHLEHDRNDVAALMLAAVDRQLGSSGRRTAEPSEISAHRWRFARTRQALGDDCWWDLGLGLAGDWCLGPDAEDAFVSGRALAQAVLQTRWSSVQR